VRVLVVDDNPDALRTLGALLTLEQHTVALAPTARLALAAAATRPFDLVLLDVQLPGMDGFEIARSIRALELGKQPLIVAMSGRRRPEDGDLRNAGIDKYLQKPVDIDALLAAVKQAA
jgi:DNA-binding response OmpR family regulator